jgi:hypothetical protein
LCENKVSECCKFPLNTLLLLLNNMAELAL